MNGVYTWGSCIATYIVAKLSWLWHFCTAVDSLLRVLAIILGCYHPSVNRWEVVTSSHEELMERV